MTPMKTHTISYLKSEMDKNDGKPRNISRATALRELGEQMFDLMLESGAVHVGWTSWHITTKEIK
jgi:hypothetical protein